MKTNHAFWAAAAWLLPTYACASEAADIDQVIVTASRDGEGVPSHLFGGSATLISDAQLEARQIRQIYDVLRDVPGVALTRTPGLGQVRIRGAEANHTLMLIDGIEAADPSFGEFDFTSLIADEGARIEVVRGQQGALFGSGAVAGVINYITLSGSEAPGTQVRAEGGSYGTIATAGRTAGVAGHMDYALSVSQLQSSGAPNAMGGARSIGSRTTNLAGKAAWAATAALRLQAIVRYTRGQSDISDADYRPGSPTFGYTIDSPGSEVKTQAAYGLLAANLDLLDGRWTHRLTGQAGRFARDGSTAFKASYGDRGEREKASYETTLRFGDPALRQRVTFAADLKREGFRNTDPTGYAFRGWRHVSNFGVVASYGAVVGDRVSLGASLRHDANNLFADANTWRVHGSARVGDGTRVHAAAGSAVQNPGFGELYAYVDGRMPMWTAAMSAIRTCGRSGRRAGKRASSVPSPPEPPSASPTSARSSLTRSTRPIRRRYTSPPLPTGPRNPSSRGSKRRRRAAGGRSPSTAHTRGWTRARTACAKSVGRVTTPARR